VFYCGIDLSARESHLCVVDDNLSIHLEMKAANELPRISDLLLPFLPDMRIVVESTFNWYWLGDGLSDQGFQVSGPVDLLERHFGGEPVWLFGVE
jgi:hypothetical protein